MTLLALEARTSRAEPPIDPGQPVLQGEDVQSPTGCQRKAEIDSQYLRCIPRADFGDAKFCCIDNQ